ncbi:mediator of RNA polymerase II transcription subunit 1 isoform X10 [Sitodiplosis mosellana]|uniref:mediator of RNA polymerase II transcription subunit 1 isoform X10 n=1 Tax=Sitodiplosis mosellana TaxID=263140 RepID=UPI00244519B1|nr:mediator of RNA polymerase II transcription subunit 1 isoform X10 [Sitodiplosis mosellana]XP_055310272.1 mediator of RNA polymerase II transcription subunit 1 isoform X10 [Sitodiplosis mosellana]
MSGKSNPGMAFSASDVTMPNCSGGGNNSSGCSLSKGSGSTERNKKWQMELLMERLRSKSAQYKPLQDTSRNIRLAMLEKRYALDMVEKSNLQKCLDRMQYCIKVTTRQGLVERLESLSRQLGLKFSDDNLNLFISSDMFYLEIILDSQGKVHDVKVHHEFKMEQQSCQELVSCLLKGDFADFTAQLEGLTSIYQLNADKKTKSNAFVALQALESDLQTLYSLYANNKDPYVLVKSSVGILQPRRGGHPMRLTYFVSPYQLLDAENSTLRPLTVDLVHAQSSIGLSVTVHLEAASSNKLQITPIVKVQDDGQGNRLPEYKPISADNSIMLPAYFVLRLNKPIVIGVNLLRQIEQITRTKFPDEIISKASPILSLIACHGSDGQITNTSKGLFVSLPDQTHCYFLTENFDLPGVVIKSIPFTEPSQVPQILRFLRQQSLFNTLITSCIRTSNYKFDIENTSMFEVSVLSCQHISIALEHPFMETMATIELDLTNIPNIKCSIFSLDGNYSNITSGLSRILQTCASIPITIRMLIKYWEREHLNKVRGLDSSLSLFCSQGGNLSANKGAFSDLENGTIKNGDASKHRGELGGERQPQRSGDNTAGSNGSGDGKSTKRRRSEDFDFFQRNDLASKDISKDMFARIQRTDTITKDVNKLLDPTTDGLFKSSQRLGDDSLKDTFRTSLTDDSKNIKFAKTNADCDKVKVNKSDSYDPNGKRLDSSGLSEPIKKKQKRPREEKLADGSSSLSSSVSITPIASMQSSSVSTSLSSTAQSTTASSSTSSNLSSVLGTSAQNLSSDHWSQQQQQQQHQHQQQQHQQQHQQQPTQSLKSSITITPINSTSKNSSSAGASGEKRTGANNGNEHSSSSNSSSSKRSDGLSSDSGRLKLEKKKKRKREDSPMGPPEKMPVTVSIKTSDGSPISPSGQQLLRKFNSSPVLQQSSKISLSSTSSKISPKHSPHSGSSSHSSPKHQSLPSPKGNHYSTSSPKHSSSAGSGKPSMSTLKSATSSPNSKSSIGPSGERVKTYSSSSGRDRQDRERDRDRDKDRDRYKYSSGSNSPKLKAKMATFIPMDSLIDASSSSQDSIKSCGSSQANKNRKSSLSAVIDKLKSARHVNDESPPNTPTLSTPQQSIGADANSVSSASTGQTVSKEKNASANTQSLNLPNVSAISITSVKNNSEYMVKHSSDGMKITINKTRTKDMTSPSSKQNYQHSSSSSSSGSGSNSPKTHTGLKPGVNSGPASKKPHASLQSSQSDSIKDSNGSQKRLTPLDPTNASNQLSSSNSTLFNSSSSTSTKSLISKSSSSGSLNSTSASLSKLSSASLNSSSSMLKGSTSSMDSYKKDKNRFTNKSGTGNGNDRAPTTNRDVMKMLGIQNPSQSLDVFGKTWDTKYQIPKLSARSSANDKDTSTTNTSTVTASPLTTQETNSNKSMVNFMSNVHSFGSNQMLSNKIHGGRASSVSPKYNLNTESISNFNKDIHIYKSTSSDALQHQSQSSGHHLQLPSSGNNAFSSLLTNKSMNSASKNLLSGTSQLSGSNKSSISNAGANVGTSSSPLPKDLMSFHDQFKKSRPPPPAKPSDSFPSNAANSLMNPNQMRNIQSSAIPPNPQTVQAAPMRQRPNSGNSPQQTFSKELSSENNGSVFWA